MLTNFLIAQGVLVVHFQKPGENVNSVSYCEVLLKIQDANCRKHPGQLAQGVLLCHDNARSLVREFTNYNGNLLNICLTAQTWGHAVT
jgi:hypothetical protein